MNTKIILSTILVAALTGIRASAYPEVNIDGVVGFQDTPMQPDGLWHVHDPARPQPPVVTPGAQFSQNANPPSDAIVLFDGKDLSEWTDKQGNPAPWKVVYPTIAHAIPAKGATLLMRRDQPQANDGVMMSAKSDIVSKRQFGDMQLHLEFREPVLHGREGQDRGNSGVFLMGLYEIQVLDCYHAKTYADGMTGAIYGQHPPQANACRPPGQWETYDIIFNAPHFDADGKLLSPAYATVIFNGVMIQNHQAIRGETNWRVPGSYTVHRSTGPLALQYHNNSVSFRNIWVRPIQVVKDP